MNADDETQSAPGETQAPNGAADDAGPTQSRRGFFRLGVAGALGATPPPSRGRTRARTRRRPRDPQLGLHVVRVRRGRVTHFRHSGGEAVDPLRPARSHRAGHAADASRVSRQRRAARSVRREWPATRRFHKSPTRSPRNYQVQTSQITNSHVAITHGCVRCRSKSFARGVMHERSCRPRCGVEKGIFVVYGCGRREIPFFAGYLAAPGRRFMVCDGAARPAIRSLACPPASGPRIRSLSPLHSSSW